MLLHRVLLLAVPLVYALGSEQGTYINPNPRQYENCEVLDLVQLAGCCNDVLRQLDGCKANDLACECCALQSMDKSCYGLCEGNPSSNFLSTLYQDCTSMNDINACSLPFKKDDTLPVERVKKAASQESPMDYVLKSRLESDYDDGDEDGHPEGGEEEGQKEEDGIYSHPNRPIVELEFNSTNLTSTSTHTRNDSRNDTNASSATYSAKSNNSNGIFSRYTFQFATIIPLIALFMY